jgi:hypothetical protein
MERFGKLCAGLALAFALGGCGAGATAPVMPGDQDAAPGGGLTRTASLVGDVGVSLDNCRWHADVPPAAIQGDAQVAIRVSSLRAGECVIEVTPPDKNKFDVPATVRVDCGSLTASQLAQSVLYEYDATTMSWVESPGSTVDSSSRSVSAQVDHFGRYTVGPVGGKAGW